MYLYHINLGYPLLDAGVRYVAPLSAVMSRTQVIAAPCDRSLLPFINTAYAI
jgi:hypothetical protein